MLEKEPYGMKKSEILNVSMFEQIKKGSYRRYSPLTETGVGELWVISLRDKFVGVEKFDGTDSEYGSYWVRMKAAVSRDYFVINFHSGAIYLNLKPFKFGNLDDCIKYNHLTTWRELYDLFDIPDEIAPETSLAIQHIIEIRFPNVYEKLRDNEPIPGRTEYFNKIYRGRIIMPACLYSI